MSEGFEGLYASYKPNPLPRKLTFKVQLCFGVVFYCIYHFYF